MHLPSKQMVVGSSPARSTNFKLKSRGICPKPAPFWAFCLAYYLHKTPFVFSYTTKKPLQPFRIQGLIGHKQYESPASMKNADAFVVTPGQLRASMKRFFQAAFDLRADVDRMQQQTTHGLV